MVYLAHSGRQCPFPRFQRSPIPQPKSGEARSRAVCGGKRGFNRGPLGAVLAESAGRIRAPRVHQQRCRDERSSLGRASVVCQAGVRSAPSGLASQMSGWSAYMRAGCLTLHHPDPQLGSIETNHWV